MNYPPKERDQRRAGNESTHVLCSPVEYPGLLEDVSQVHVGVQEVWVERHRLLEVVYGQPDLALGVEDAPEVAPGHGEVGPGLDGLQVARLMTGFVGIGGR